MFTSSKYWQLLLYGIESVPTRGSSADFLPLMCECVQVEGVVRFVSAKDVSGGNRIGAVMKDEECFATDEVSVIRQNTHM